MSALIEPIHKPGLRTGRNLIKQRKQRLLRNPPNQVFIHRNTFFLYTSILDNKTVNSGIPGFLSKRGNKIAAQEL
jgi:hypothetical protein